jgi:predicted nucleic acid-binding protein
MAFLLDTNLISEWVKPQPNPGAITWLAGIDEDRVFLSVVTLAELRSGVERLVAGARRARLEHWLVEGLPARFEHRIMPIDAPIADLWGRIIQRGLAAGRLIGATDGFIAATAARHSLTLVTHNTSDFDPLGLSLLDPWT